MSTIDPTGGVAGKIGQKIVNDATKQNTQVDKDKFSDLLTKQTHDTDKAAEISKVANSENADVGIVSKSVQNRSQKTSEIDVKGIKGLLNSWEQDSTKMNKITDLALSGQKFSPSQLIALQAATFKLTFGLQTASKLVETATNAVRTTMQTPL